MNAKAKQIIRRALEKPYHDQTRKERILVELASGHWVSSWVLCTKGGGTGYRTRISELNKAGIHIDSRRNPRSPKGKTWWEYRLARDDQVAV